MSTTECEKRVESILRGLRGMKPLQELFWRELNYERVAEPLSRRGWSNDAATPLAEDPQLFAAGGEDNRFHVIYNRLASDSLPLAAERPVVSRLLRDHQHALFVFSNRQQDRWHFLNVKYDESLDRRRLFRRITVGPEEKLRTASERISMLDIESVGKDMFGLSSLAIQNRHDEAFDVEKVTDEFFAGYTGVFRTLQADLVKASKDRRWAHDYSLQFLNRCMFLYFIQRKRWLGEDPDFLASFWNAYSQSGQPRDSFVERWLNVLFFEAFNRKSAAGHRHFPDPIRDALIQAPYLNGGLFTESDLDRHPAAHVSDDRFEQAFKFLEKYNFTIAEDSPLDKEVAVDPEMIGKVYESLVNVSEEVDERGEAGIFYTPRTEIDLMCRVALTDYLANHLGPQHKSLLNHLLFALDPGEKAEADREVTRAGLWREIDRLLRALTVLDPACGSGSFLVGMLHILDDLQQRAAIALGRKPEDAFTRKRRIIGQSLYGVDAMEWACRVAELRLWLALVVDADLTLADLAIRQDPLLPHFSFKIRCGDSLVQEVGGVNLGHMRGALDLPADVKRAITVHKSEKLKFYNNDRNCRFRTVKEAEHEELRLFRDVLGALKHKAQDEIHSLTQRIKGPPGRQMNLDGSVEKRPMQLDLKAAEWQAQIEANRVRIARFEDAIAALKTTKDVPFVWDIAFVEVFEGDEKGFDIVVGNPPYVRQESIAAPEVCGARATDDKQEYKAELAHSVYQAWPSFFRYDSANPKRLRKLDAKSDLYIYFYFHGLSLLNPKGSFCFVTSNSWLDVGYGKDLQEFLLKHSHVKLVFDNQVKRTFAAADVNTVMVLLAAPDDERQTGPEQVARFVMFKVPFEHIVSPVVFDEVEAAAARTATKEFRVNPVQQSVLLEDGMESPDREAEGRKPTGPLIKVARYIGGKWGGKYLRAPEVYWRVVDAAREKLVPLGSLAEIRFGIKTGADDWFYLTKERARELGIERRFLRPVLTDPGDRNVPGIRLTAAQADRLMIVAQGDKTALRGTALSKWIHIGETEQFKGRGDTQSIPASRPSVAGRARWYELPPREPSPILWTEVRKRRSLTLLNEAQLLADRSFYDVIPQAVDPRLLCALLNCTATALFCEIQGNAPGGSGAGVQMTCAEVRRLPVLDPRSLPTSEERALMRAFDRLCGRPIGSLESDCGSDDRRDLDASIFRVLGLDVALLDDMYTVVKRLVRDRLTKSKSFGVPKSVSGRDRSVTPEE